MDLTQIGVLFGSFCGAVGALGGGLCTWGIGAYLKYKSDKREDAKLEDAREDQLSEKEDKTLRYIIGIQEGDLKSLRAEIKEMQAAYRTELATMRENHRSELKNIHDAHNDCELRYTALETEMRIKLLAMDTRVGKVERHVDPKEIAAEVAKTRHDIKDDLNTVSMKVTEVQQTLAAHDSGVFKPDQIINPKQ